MQLVIPLNSVAGDRMYDADDVAQMFAAVLTNGVHPMPANCLLVEPVAPAAGFFVTLSPGTCVINGRLGVNESPLTLKIERPDTSLPRVDTVVLRLDLVDREIKELVVTGAPALSPKPTPLIQNDLTFELCLAQITVLPTDTAVQSSGVLDTRKDPKLCGIVASLLKPDPTLTDEYFKSVVKQSAIFETSRVSGSIPVSSWRENTALSLFQAEFSSPKITANSDVSIIIALDSLTIPIYGSGSTFDGFIRLYAPSKPTAQLNFLAVITKTGYGGD